MTKLNTIRACLSLFIVMLKKIQNAVNFILMNDVSVTLEQHLASRKNTRACQALKLKDRQCFVNYMEPVISLEKS